MGSATKTVGQLNALLGSETSAAAQLLARIPGAQAGNRNRAATFDVVIGALLRLHRLFLVTDPTFGAKGDGVDDRGAIAAADAAAIAAGGGTLVFPPCAVSYAVGSNLSVTSPTLHLAGSLVAPATGVTLTLNGAITAAKNVFGGLGKVKIFPAVVGPVNPQWWAFATASLQISAALSACGDVNGVLTSECVIDARGYVGTQDLSTNIMVGTADTDLTRYTILWGPARFRVAAGQTYKSNCLHQFFDSEFIMMNSSNVRVTGINLWNPTYRTTTCSSTATSNQITVPSTAYIDIGSPVVIGPSFRPRGGRDNTTVTGAHTNAVTTITVGSTTGFMAAGTIRIGTEIITYTSKDATHFLGCTRGAQGTTAGTYVGAEAVDRAVQDCFYVTAIVGNVLTLDSAIDVTATALTTIIGPKDFAFLGRAVFDGNKDPNDANDDLQNPMAVSGYYTRRGHLSQDLVIKNWDHGGFNGVQCQDNYIRGHFINNGRQSLGLGTNIWLFGGAKRNRVIVSDENGQSVVAIDDRSTNPQDSDNTSDDNSVDILHAKGTNEACVLEGSSRNTVLVRCGTGLVSNGFRCSSPQWVTPGAPSFNDLEIKSIQNPGAMVNYINADSTLASGGNTFRCRQRGALITVPWGNTVEGPMGMNTLAYSASMTPDRSIGHHFIITVNNGTAFTVNAPTHAWPDADIYLEFNNTSGGAMGAVTITAYKLAGAFVAPATGNRRVYGFRYNWNDGLWREIYRSPADMT